MTFYIKTLPQAFHELQHYLEVLDKGSIIFHDSAQGDKLVRGYPFFIPITRWKSIQSPQKKEATESRIHKKLIMNIFVIPASQKWRAGSCISLWIKEWRFTCWHSNYYGSVLKPLLKKGKTLLFSMDLLTYSLGRRFRRVGDNVLLMRDIEAYLPWGSAKDR